MPLLCTNCFEVLKDELKYNLDYILNHTIDCPKASCTGYWDGKVIEVDELMLPTIIELNKKGYITTNCCSGHYYANKQSGGIAFDFVTAYIRFADSYDFNDADLPPGFEHEISDNGGDVSSTIRKKFRQQLTDGELFKQIIEDAGNLYEWANGLPPCEGY